MRTSILFFTALLSLFFINCSTSNEVSKNITHNCFKYVFAENLELLEKNIQECANHRSSDQMSTLMMAALKGNNKMVRLLIENGANINSQDGIGQNSLSYAVLKNHADTVELLVANGARIVSNEYGITSLMTAVQMGHPELVRAMKPGAKEVNMRTQEGWTALYFAIRGGKKEIFDYLIEQGACTELKDDLKQSPLQFATEIGWWHAQHRLQHTIACR